VPSRKDTFTRIPQFIDGTMLLMEMNNGGAQQIKIGDIERMALMSAIFYYNFNSKV
jgi:hypothetical protein